MIAKCISNKGVDLPENYLDSRRGYTKSTVLNFLEVGHSYVIYALCVREDQVWFYVCEDEDDEYPVARPAPLFELTDPRLPTTWMASYKPDYMEAQLFISSVEWIQEEAFYEKLVDGSEREVLMFNKIKNEMNINNVNE